MRVPAPDRAAAYPAPPAAVRRGGLAGTSLLCRSAQTRITQAGRVIEAIPMTTIVLPVILPALVLVWVATCLHILRESRRGGVGTMVGVGALQRAVAPARVARP